MNRLTFPIFLMLVMPIGGRAADISPSVSNVLNAIEQVETGGRDVTGDGGAAIGPLQVHRACWIDSKVDGQYSDCHDAAYARRVAIGYWTRYCPKALETGDAETLARTWNGGGPSGARKKATIPYWNKVKAALEAQ